MKFPLILVAVATCFSSLAQDNKLQSTGDVGIGTLTPSAKLDVNGNMIVDSCVLIKDSLTVEQNARILSNLKVDGTSKMYHAEIGGGLLMNNLQTASAPYFDILVSMPNGTVMKTGPGALFPVPNEPVGFCDLQGSNYLGNPYWISQPNKLYTACPEILVGVNTETPRVSLDVVGRTYAQKLFMGNANPTQSGNDIYFHLDVPFAETLDKTVFKVENEGRQLFSINNNGLIRTREIRIDAETWADHVFLPTYSLRPLSEVESFIEMNGHLPDVPSEKEVQENGINVSEMNALLLQKIEELTLYTIELEKRMKELEQEKND